MNLNKKIKLELKKVEPTHWKENEVGKNIENLIYNWSEIRKYYPGWLIVPSDNRRNLWSNTYYFFGNVINNIYKISAPNNIIILAELFWIYDKCLLSISIEDEVLIENILNKYNPFPTLFEQDNQNINPTLSEYKDLDWNRIKQSWVFLYKLLISDSRRDLNSDKFFTRISIIEKLIELENDIYDFVNYEKCLFYLSKFDEIKLFKILKEWNIEESNSLFIAKKASILAEVGLIEEAINISKKTLNTIRKQYKDTYPNYFLMSLEGWIMMLNHYLNSFYDDDVLFYPRLEKLSIYKCDPFFEFDTLKKELNKSEPKEKPRKEIIEQFDNDMVTIRSNFDNNYFDEYIPAFAYLRIFEETCIPMSLRHYSPDKYIIIASKWLKKSLPIWSISCILRSCFNKEEILDEFISRFYVANLTEKSLNQLVDYFLPSFINSITNLNNSNHNLDFSYKTINVLSDLLSKIAIRNINDLKDILLKNAILLYNNPLTRNNNDISKQISKLFKRILVTFTQAELVNNLPALIDLPIKNEKGFDIKYNINLIDPFYYIDIEEDTLIPENVKQLLSNRIDKLIKLLYEETQETRNIAILRLSILNRINCLTKIQMTEFTKALYSKVDEYGIPKSNLYDQSILLLPNNGNDIKKIIKSKYLELEIPKITNKQIKDGKVVSISSSVSKQTEYYIDNIDFISVPLFPKNKMYRDKYINWNPEEAKILLNKLIDFWEYEKGGFDDYDEFDIFGATKNVTENFDRLLSRIIIPKLSNDDSNIKEKLRTFLKELEKKNILIQASNVASLRLFPENKAKINKSIQKGINSLSIDIIKNNLDAIFLWLTFSNRNEIEQIEFDYIKEIINRILVRRQPGLFDYILYLNIIIKYLPFKIKDSRIENLISALEFLIDELDYKNYDIISYRKNKVSKSKIINLNYNDIPKYRTIVSELTYNLLKKFQKGSIEIPLILKKWEDSCRNDPLPEVRYYWQ
jgi:hypothetical protein